MLKTVFYFVLLLLSFVTMTLAKGAAKPPAKGTSKNPSKGKGKDDNSTYDARKNCYINCDSMPAKTNAKVGKLICYGICDKNHPVGPTFGCYNKYCWSSCSGAGIGEEWCYTSKADHTQSFEYVACKEDSECKKDWHCAGSCTI